MESQDPKGHQGSDPLDFHRAQSPAQPLAGCHPPQFCLFSELSQAGATLSKPRLTQNRAQGHRILISYNRFYHSQPVPLMYSIDT